MTDPFASLIPEARTFLTALAADNTRDWFAAHKGEYEARLKRPAELLLDEVAQALGRVVALPLAPKLFRAQRDLRFSKDKTPYHTHLHMSWTVDGTAGFFFGIAPDYVTTGGGVMAFPAGGVDRWREMVAASAEIADEIAGLAPLGFALREPELKRVPVPWPADHPRADLLRRKGLVLWRAMDAPEQAAPLATLLRQFTMLAPLVRRLSEI